MMECPRTSQMGTDYAMGEAYRFCHMANMLLGMWLGNVYISV